MFSDLLAIFYDIIRFSYDDVLCFCSLQYILYLIGRSSAYGKTISYMQGYMEYQILVMSSIENRCLLKIQSIAFGIMINIAPDYTDSKTILNIPYMEINSVAFRCLSSILPVKPVTIFDLPVGLPVLPVVHRYIFYIVSDDFCGSRNNSFMSAFRCI